MKKLLIFSLVFMLLMGQAFAWGPNGHRVVGHIAQEHLSKKAKKKLMNLLHHNSLAEVSVWMDDIRSDDAYDHTHDWHWVTIPDSLKYDETEKNPKGDLIMKIEELVALLKNGNLNPEQEAEFVKYLVHMVGDLHQPLHVGTGEDMGGNAVKVEWFGKPSNLHHVWDTDMIEGKNLSYTELADFLGEPKRRKIKEWQSSSIRDWAYENKSLRPQVYDIPESGKLGYEYSYQHFDLVQKRLLQAGIRLASLLNDIYG